MSRWHSKFNSSKYLAAALREFRNKNSVTLREIEKHTGISNAFISQFERELSDISYSNAKIICNFMSNFKKKKANKKNASEGGAG